MTPHCRCIYCSHTSKVADHLSFVGSEKKIGRSKEVWGVCHRCLAKAMAQVCEDVSKCKRETKA